jgi:2'-hydroxyisoflavone reductase
VVWTVDPKDGSESYGVQKAQCEEIVRAAFGKGSIVVRPSYIVGPGDTSDRFPYWPQRLAKGGLTLAPGKKSDSVQMVDVRDLVAFYLKLLEERLAGTYNAAGPREALTMEGFLDQAMKALGSTSQLVWIVGRDRQGHAGVVGHGARGTSRQAPLHHHT